MKIKSDFKDYYDFVEHLYGRDDKDVVYSRKRIGPTADKESPYETRVTLEVDPSFIGVPTPIRTSEPLPEKRGEAARQAILLPLVLGGKYVYIVRKVADGGSDWEEGGIHKVPRWSDFEVVTKKSRPALCAKLGQSTIFQSSTHLLDLTRKVGHPVYLIEDVGRIYNKKGKYITIHPRVPNLGELGLAAIIPPQQMYQDLDYFLSNTINPSPDTSPPTVMSNEEKIVQHGFDLKQSFRHRK